jgi:hypothetical protein
MLAIVKRMSVVKWRTASPTYSTERSMATVLRPSVPRVLRMTSLPPNPKGSAPAVLDGDGLGDLDPALAQHHGHRDVRAAQADGEGAEPAVAAGVAVGPEHDLTGLHQIPVEPGVHDGLVGVVEVLDAGSRGRNPG